MTTHEEGVPTWFRGRGLRFLFMLVPAALLLTLAWHFWGAPRPVLSPSERLQCELPAPSRSSARPGMVWVPAGQFAFGDTMYPEEQPVRQAKVGGFWMDRTEVTNAQFAEFVAATGYVTVAERSVNPLTHPGVTSDMLQPGAVVFEMPRSVNGLVNVSQWWHYIVGANWRHPGGPATSIDGHGDFPVVDVTYEDALAYALWKGVELPLEVEWEWAARAARPEPAADHEQPAAANTWQGIFPIVNSGEDGFVGLAPVGCYAPNALGLYDMIGNAWELTASRWSPNHSDSEMAPDQVPLQLRGAPNMQRVIKGGSYLCAPNYCMRYRAGSRQPQEEDLGASHLGFRTISRISRD